MIQIRKQFRELNQQNKLVIIIIIWNMLSPFLIGFFQVPRTLLYLTDVVNAFLFLCVVKGQGGRIKRSAPIMWMLFFMLICIVSALINATSPILAIWGMRQNFRYFVFFYACATVMNEKCIKVLMKIIEVVFWISLPLCVYEALFVTYSVGTIVGDMVGGIYYRVGGNAPLNIILCLYTCNIMLQCFEKKQKFTKLLLVMAAAMSMAVLAELKIFLVEIVVITLYCAIVNKMNWKAILLIIVGVLAINIVVNMFVAVNARGRSYYTSDLFSIESMIQYASRTSGYDGNGDLNRMTAIGELKNRFFDNDIMGLLFGRGIGSAEFSKSSTALTSEFYNQYSGLHYQYFGHAFIFIETGIIGLFTYLMIFISSLYKSIFRWKNKEWRKFYIMSLLLMSFLIFYNTTMRNEFCAYIMYAILAIPLSKPFEYSNCNEVSKYDS
ncbi:MAG: hypothetical protein ACRQFF_12965 [Sphaerochaeta sp.]